MLNTIRLIQVKSQKCWSDTYDLAKWVRNAYPFLIAILAERNNWMCHNCSKTCHRSCLEEWMKRARKCPNCRHSIRRDLLKQNLLISQILDVCGKPKKTSIPPINIEWKEHKEQISFFCLKCNKKICEGCINEDQHCGHQIRSVKFIFQQRKEKAIEESKSLTAFQEQIEEDFKKLTDLKKSKLDAIDSATQQITNELQIFLAHQNQRYKKYT